MNSHPFSATNSFEVQLLCLAPPPSWLQELQDQPVTCELGLPRHWSYRHGRWRRIDGCQDIMLSYTTIIIDLLGILRLLLILWLLLFLSIYFFFLFSFILFLSLFPFFYFIIFQIAILNISILISILTFFVWFSVWTNHCFRHMYCLSHFFPDLLRMNEACLYGSFPSCWVRRQMDIVRPFSSDFQDEARDRWAIRAFVHPLHSGARLCLCTCMLCLYILLYLYTHLHTNLLASLHVQYYIHIFQIIYLFCQYIDKVAYRSLCIFFNAYTILTYSYPCRFIFTFLPIYYLLKIRSVYNPWWYNIHIVVCTHTPLILNTSFWNTWILILILLSEYTSTLIMLMNAP